MSINPLSREDYHVVQSALDVLTEEGLRHGLVMTLEHDFDEFVALRKSLGDGFCYPSVDPKFSNVGADAFWLRVTDESGFLVAIMAERMYRCDDFMELLRNTRLWFDKGPVAVSPEFRPINGFDAFGGIVGHGSGLWVDPAFRRHGVSSFLPDYYRAIALRHYQIDWHTCIVFQPLNAHARKAYKYSEVELVIDGYFPVTGGISQLYLCRIARADIIAHLRAPTLSLSLTREAVRAPAAAVG